MPPPVVPPPVEPPAPVTPVLPKGSALPGVVFEILQILGGSGPGGAVEPGDTLMVDFRVKNKNSVPIPVPELNVGRVYISGPTFNYQVVIPSQSDLRARSVQNLDGSWRYTFGMPIPDVFAAPPNDSPSFGPGDGELTGQMLLDGTYTFGMEGYKLYNVDGVDYRDADNASMNFLFGSATTLEHREVVTQENCDQCHRDLRAHGGNRKDVINCLLCHVSGSEDRNVATAAGGTPGASIDFRVMIHKIHNGKHLPSVNGVGTFPASGLRNYGVAPKPYELVGFNNSVIDFSHVAFPVWPNLSFGMPRDEGYSGIGAPAQAQESQILLGVTACDKCHGDPDGSGPLMAPAQGQNAYTQQSRRACGSCHDDVDWNGLYRANTLEMGAQTDDASCTFCHGNTGSTLDPVKAHVHPMKDAMINPGVNFEIVSLTDIGNGDGKFTAGEKLQVQFNLEEEDGDPIVPASPFSINVAITGPTTNRNLLLNTSIPLAGVGSGPPYTIRVPELVQLEFVGDFTALPQTFTTSRTPHWNVTGALTTVNTAVTTATMSTSVAPIRASQNYIDLVSSAGFLRNDYIVVDNNLMTEEYLRIQFVDGNRIWFGSLAGTQYHPATRFAHGMGATVHKVTLTARTAPADYTLNAATGMISAVTNFGAGAGVLVTYTTDYVIPAVYPASINDSPDLTEQAGEWAGLPILDGTYTLGFWASKTFTYTEFLENNSYRATSENSTANIDFLVGSAMTLEPGEIIASKDNCNACHDTIYFHGGGRRGFDNCILCHGSAGGEDRSRYVAANAPATTGVSIDFRQLLHKIHMGEELANAATYQVVGFGSAAYPNNYGIVMFDEVVFPALPEGVKDCDSCHGNNAWKVPTARLHPMQTLPTLSWREACSSCHDSAAAIAHIKAQTSPAGVESCLICHGPGELESVETKHRVR